MPHSYEVSLAGVRFPLLPTSTLTTNAEAAKTAATRICRRTGKYSPSIRNSLKPGGFRYFTPARWPFCWAIALAKAEGNPLYFLPFFLTAPRATRFCNFSYARKRSISSPPLAALRARRFSCTMSNNCLNSNDERRERTATSSSVTRSGTRRENAFFFRIAIRATNIACFRQTAALFFVLRRLKHEECRNGAGSGRRADWPKKRKPNAREATTRLPLQPMEEARGWASSGVGGRRDEG